ncbi:Methyltransferase-like protein 5 [Amphibalanus amphitrite]|uniref:Methyltransferase-like protein 5 n=1 Tax=Amphibalanus amphitrite TaxID=1232801 RepID=A0A6A4X624_AMPAM|nr:rRNA N6-adenosine-methyltransferase METTL5-like [Amphibalanus amphitrite]XP_043190918.1 rRNA N6-adenosine-methyltransferase METTL5-like [Amphibalanus amphitrite]XP_043190919.1 rRNA N6-adenosine-methyltransferase METTL5-like [Amphibalanus amphitrite]XP_043190920.1 rRNA N6-adenosine-methyltransferase METTL5-like [Amphibalanus amphitrite]XP_043190921.1 rRNA N6-adenosine-methyltransferase METTL5-like [Amphibalanus amphitrite]XP_043190922.1 rRNA N6-adenosine-methyltransferase METTL5-like [Amphib
MAVCMKLWQLESLLQQLDGFERPKVKLEQYVTPAHIAACLLHTAQASFGDIAGRAVADLGCGPGVLAAGAAALGAGSVLAVDIDEDALATARANLEEAELPAVDLLQADVQEVAQLWRQPVDTVITNPPFGTKRNAGADMRFLQAALELAGSAVYSLHKRSTRRHVQRQAELWAARATVVAELRYDLPSTYGFHRRASVDIEVDLWRTVPGR